MPIEVVATNAPPTGEKRKELSSAADAEGSPQKKKVKKNECNFEGCTKYAQQGGVCVTHGAKRKLCSVINCTNKAVKGGVCQRHGAKIERCSVTSCTMPVQKGGLCMRHGNIYDREMAMNNNNLGNNSAGNNNDFNAFQWPYPTVGMPAMGWNGQGVFPNAMSNVPRGWGLQAHTTNMVAFGNSELPIPTTMPLPKKICNVEGCTNQPVSGGVVCIRHGAKVKLCSSEGCPNQAKKGGVCQKHGAKRKRCSVINCTKQAVKGGVCQRHRNISSSEAEGNELVDEAVQDITVAEGSVEGLSPQKERVKKKYECKVEGCTKYARNGGVCKRHYSATDAESRPQKKKNKKKGGGYECSFEGCTKYAQQGGVCVRHGAKRKSRARGEVNVDLLQIATDVAPAQKGEGGGSDAMGGDDDWGGNDGNECDFGGDGDGDVNLVEGKHSNVDPEEIITAGQDAEIKRLTAELKDAKNELNEQRKKMSDELKELITVSEENRLLREEENRRLRAAFEEKSQKIQDLTAAKEAAYAKLREVTTIFESSKSSWTRWGQEMRAKLNRTEKSLEAKSEAAAKLQVDVDRLKAENAELRSRLQLSTRNEDELL